MRAFGLTCAAIAIALGAAAQEPLNTLLDRGYVAHWLVCGPFAPDGEGGIAGALKRGSPPLTDTDYMKPVGGASTVLPRHLMKVPTSNGSATWQQAGAQDETLDLAPFFPDAAEGVAYAAFYTQAPASSVAYFNLQTPLGARVWVNGLPVRDLRVAPVTVTGVDRFVAALRAGTNLVLIEVPGATLSKLAEMAATTEIDFKARGFQNRPLLHGASGYEIGLRIMPASQLGPVAYVPKLRATGRFSGEGSELSQETVLTFFNPSRTVSPAISVTARVPGSGETLKSVVNAISPESESEVILSIPIASTPAGKPVNVEVTLDAGDKRATFASAVVVKAPPEAGTIYLVTGAHFSTGKPEDQRTRTERRIEETARQAALLDKEQDYGFDLGAAEEWAPFWNARPSLRASVIEAVARGRCAANAGYTTPDERIVSGELLARNIVYGVMISRNVLGDAGNCYHAWDAPGLCAQTPQLLAKASVQGIVSNLKLSDIAELSWRIAPNGDRLLHRRKQSGAGVRSATELRETAAIQRRELLERGISSDILVNESALAPPESFFLGACSALARSTPAIKITGNGGGEFLANALETIKRKSINVPLSGRSLMSYRPGEVVAQTQLKQTFARAENRLLTAEKLSTAAAMLGAVYPDATLDASWRQLLFSSSPDRLGFAETGRVFVDSLAATRDALALADGVRDRAMRYLASQVDTYASAPNKAEGAFAIVVFNPSNWKRADICDVEVNVKALLGLTLMDESGAVVPYWAEGVRPGVARLHFVAKSVPSLGYCTYFATPGKSFPPLASAEGAQIENEFFALVADAHRGGAIVSVKDKKSGAEFVQGLMNDVASVAEDPAKNHGGRDFWTSGAVARISSESATISVSKSPNMQRLNISAPFEGGRVEREVTLYAGVPRIDCFIQFKGLSREDKLYAVTFGTAGTGCAPVSGDRYGASVGFPGRKAFDYRTDSGKNPSATGLQPALEWFAASPNDHIQIGMDQALPLAPAQIIFGTEPALDRAARDLQAAFVARGIPCEAGPDTPRKLNTVWTDSTESPNLNDELDHCALRIVLGNPTQNLLCKNLCRQFDGATLSAFTERMREGATLLFNDSDVPKGNPPVPTLILAGETTTQTTSLATSVAESLEAGGVIQIPSDASVIADLKPQPETGTAILFEGAGVAGIEPGGAAVLALFHGSSWLEQATDLPKTLAPNSATYRYALYPFSGAWREAGIPRMAREYAEPLLAVTVPLHLGQIPARASFLDVQDPNFIVTAMKPTVSQAMTMSGQETLPVNGITVRGYESIGQRWEGSLSFLGGLRAAAQTDLLDHASETLGYSGKSAVFTCGAFSIETLSLLPSVAGATGPKTSLSAPVEDTPTVFSRYWLHNRGTAPTGLQKLSVALAGKIDEKDANVELVVANNQPDTPVRGTVALTASEGWSLAPAQVDYDLKPGASVSRQIVMLHDGAGTSPAGLIARTEYDGRSYWDILEQGGEAPALEVTRSGNEARAVIKNSGTLPLIGYVDAITPEELGRRPGAVLSTTVTPRRTPVSVAPFGEQKLVFQIASPGVPDWIVLRLAANGRVVYSPVEVHGGE
ncbi:MAG: hypothetical protein HZB26_10660 [Candidatus Hydrogenedentes bacterium]|nr:hypothetical protein [Candidatus Hydrogenedentota bacterium]